jgi:hypothetical protein
MLPNLFLAKIDTSLFTVEKRSTKIWASSVIKKRLKSKITECECRRKIAQSGHLDLVHIGQFVIK